MRLPWLDLWLGRKRRGDPGGRGTTEQAGSARPEVSLGGAGRLCLGDLRGIAARSLPSKSSLFEGKRLDEFRDENPIPSSGRGDRKSTRLNSSHSQIS